MLTKDQKAIQLEELTKKLADAKSVVLTSFRGLKINDMIGLRKTLREKGVDYKVIKNSLLKRAFEKHNQEIPAEILEKPLAIAFDFKEDMEAIKAIYAFSKQNEFLEISAGVFENALVDGQAIIEIAQLPGKDELYAKLAGSISAPISKFIYALRWNGQALTSVLKQYLENKS